MIGIKAYAGYIPRLRMDRKTVAEANAWYAPSLKGKGRGTRAMANWDEDTITMAVAAARGCLEPNGDRDQIESLVLASTTLPFADRLNAGVVSAALNLSERVDAADMTGSQRVALTGFSQSIDRIKAGANNILLAAADRCKANVASTQELDYGDAGAALMLGSGDDVVAEFIGSAVVTDDFVDHFRASDEAVDYQWEERWVRDEGIGKLVPKAIKALLDETSTVAADINHLVFPTTFKRLDTQVAMRCGISAEALADNLSATVGDSGAAQGLLMLANVLESAKPGELILLTQFGQGAEAILLRVTDQIAQYQPRKKISEYLAVGVTETSYTRFLAYNDQVSLERGMRGEQDKKTALSTMYRHRKMLTGFIAGRCRETGQVHFPPTRFSSHLEKPLLDTQDPYPLADRIAAIVSLSADYLSFHLAPPNQYGLVDFVGGGRLLMEFTDLVKGDVDTGSEMEMVFRIKDIDAQRGFKRYFWKAKPVNPLTQVQKSSESARG